ncbi:MAG: ribosome-associated GTPase EngA [Halobacteriovoraceae bacterium]|nr:ribosome-associated GTPase EngA [Halobacteriovoraceae bacterium]MCB9094235.1 ribosome-associated GTPase EngA [Halobacteriovoraceae bacterium]
MKRTPVISLIGRPNVGKSTIFNRLLKNSAKAITHNKPGVTRDRHYGIVTFQETELEKVDAIVIDTGGFYPDLKDDHSEEMFSEMAKQAELAISESDIVLIVMDAREGLIPFDKAIVDFTRKSKKDFWVIINKFDSEKQSGEESEFFQLGVDDMFLTSAEHARGISELRERLHRFCFEKLQSEDEFLLDTKGVKPRHPVVGKIAIVGAPNAGKSTLLNQLLQAERAVVSSQAGTTIDPIEGFMDIDFGASATLLDRNPFHFKKDAISLYHKFIEEIENAEENALEEGEAPAASTMRSLMIIDTAGIRRKAQVAGFIESQSVYRSLRAIADSDVVVYMVDGEKGLTHQDKKLMGIAIDKGKSLVICVNKIDLNQEVFDDRNERKEYLLDFMYDLPWLTYCKPLFISAKEKIGFKKLKEAIRKSIMLRRRYISTGELNKTLHQLVEENPVMIRGGSGTRLKLKYAAMVKATPPTFLLFTNRSQGIPVNFRRYLVNGLRKKFSYENTPIHLVFRRGDEKSLEK